MIDSIDFLFSTNGLTANKGEHFIAKETQFFQIESEN